MGGRGCGGLGTLFKEFYFVQKIIKFSPLGFRWGEGGAGALGAAWILGFLLVTARPLYLRRVNFPDNLRNSCWFMLGCGFLGCFFFKFEIFDFFLLLGLNLGLEES